MSEAVNPDVEEVERYNLMAKRAVCDHSASITEMEPDMAGYASYCPACDTYLSDADSLKWRYAAAYLP